MIIESAKISASKFKWTNRAGTAFASDLGYRAGQVPVHQIYDDACDGGLYVIGRKENKAFIFSRALVKGNGEVYGWLFNSACNDYSLTIFND